MGNASTASQSQEMDMDSLQLMKCINEVNECHIKFVSVIQRRYQSIDGVMFWWNKGDVASAINSLNLQNDLGLTMDVINYTIAQGYRLKMLKHEHVTSILN